MNPFGLFQLIHLLTDQKTGALNAAVCNGKGYNCWLHCKSAGCYGHCDNLVSQHCVVRFVSLSIMLALLSYSDSNK
jgi:hypothetical protein